MTRLLVVLLSLLLALPAASVPACHGDAPVAANAHHMPHGDAPLVVATGHDCIGCIPPSDWTGARIAAPFVPDAGRQVPAPARDRFGASLRPIPPPPRGA